MYILQSLDETSRQIETGNSQLMSDKVLDIVDDKADIL